VKPYEKLQRYWAGGETGIHTAAGSEQAVDGLEWKYGVRLPREFRAYLIYSCPADDGLDQDFTSWWSVDRIKNIVDEYAHPIHHGGLREKPRNICSSLTT
jgi:hypothetical protein